MSQFLKTRNCLPEKRFAWAQVVVVLILSVLGLRLWHIQVFKGEYYTRISKHNLIRKISVDAPRGEIYDRHGKLILGNRTSFNLVMVPQYAQEVEKTLYLITKLLHIPYDELSKSMQRSAGQPVYLPVILKRDLSLHEVSAINSNILSLPGIEVVEAPQRDYRTGMPSHLLGYLTEINSSQLRSKNAKIKTNQYLLGDMIGKHGLEKSWEPYLRGERGFKYIQIDAFGRRTRQDIALLSDLKSKPVKKGANLLLTIDSEIQKTALEAFKGKNGAVIAMNPANGEIYALVSEPKFDLGIFQKGVSFATWQAMVSNPYKPLLDKTTGGIYPPGSIYKALVALVALEEKIVTPNTKFFCEGKFVLGSDTFHCHRREGHGWVNLKDALKHSCDVYFYHIGTELPVDVLEKYAREFGLGQKLGLGLNMESRGIVPSTSWKKRSYNLPWSTGETLPIVIGQGYNAMTPMQMATLYSAIANGGSVWRPYVVKSVIDYTGRVVEKIEQNLISQTSLISEKSFDIVRRALQAVVQEDGGTGHRANIDGVDVGGKTGTVQIVKLDKFKSHDSISSQWREHAIFAAFSPTKKSEIVVLVVSENDKIGGGGKAAAPVARQIIEKYYEIYHPEIQINKSIERIAVRDDVQNVPDQPATGIITPSEEEDE